MKPDPAEKTVADGEVAVPPAGKPAAVAHSREGPRPRGPSVPDASAFSLLEMLLALAIFAILLGIVLASMPRWQQEARVKRATELTKAGLEFARSRANAVNRRTTFRCTNSMTRPVTGSFIVQDDLSATCPQPAQTLPVGVAFATNTSIITFVPGSRTTSEGDVSLALGVWGTSFTSTLLVSAASATVRQIP